MFGGGKAKTVTTKVAPSKEVDAILRKVTNLTQGMDVGNFVDQRLAGLNANQQQALTAMNQSVGAKQLADLYTPRTQIGLDRMNDVMSQLQTLGSSDGGVTGSQVNDYASQLGQSNSAQAGNRAVANVSLGSNTTSDAIRRGQKVGTERQQAITDLSRNQYNQGQGARALLQGQSSKIGALNSMGQAAGVDINNGQFGANQSILANQNKLNAGNIQQAQDNAQNQMDWQNAMGAQSYDWDRLNNQLNVLNTVSPMAGYTQTNTAARPSNSNALLGAGLSIGGALASKYFGGAATNARAGGEGGFSSLMAQPSNNSSGYSMPSSNGSGFGGFFSNLGQGFGSLFSSQ